MKKRTVEYHLNKAGEYKTKAIQFSLKGNYDKAGYYTILSEKQTYKAEQIKKEETK